MVKHGSSISRSNNISYNEKEVLTMLSLIDIFKKRKRKPSVLMTLLNSPDDHVFTMTVEEDEVVIRIKRKEIKDETKNS